MATAITTNRTSSLMILFVAMALMTTLFTSEKKQVLAFTTLLDGGGARSTNIFPSNHRNVWHGRPTTASVLFFNKGEINAPSFTKQRRRTTADSCVMKLKNNDEEIDDELKQQYEEANRKIWKSRRNSIRWALKQAENIKNYRLYEMEPVDEETSEDKAKSAVTITAFVVAIGVVILRIGGRAALVSTLGLDFANENPELKQQLDQALVFFNSDLGPIWGPMLFVAAWTAVKVLCVDALGVVLALSSGILFGGVIEGTLMSAFGATFGSTVAFLLAKADTPVRTKALELIDEYPALRGIERVVAQDGIKAILTLRLAPVLPIPIGMYNYVYGITNVPLADFCAGIFLGSLKPYLLDAYLGYFGKQLVDGSSSSDFEDYLLLALLGASVLIGVFASQLASETWDAVKKEVEQEAEASKKEQEVVEEDIKEPTNLFDTLKQSYQKADTTIDKVIEQEYSLQLWNITSDELPKHLDPSMIDSNSIENTLGSTFDVGQSIMEGLVFAPKLITSIMKYCDPEYDDTQQQRATTSTVSVAPATTLDSGERDTATTKLASMNENETRQTVRINNEDEQQPQQPLSLENSKDKLDNTLETLQELRIRMQKQLESLDDKMNSK